MILGAWELGSFMAVLSYSNNWDCLHPHFLLYNNFYCLSVYYLGFLLPKSVYKPGIVVYAYSPSPWKAEAGES